MRDARLLWNSKSFPRFSFVKFLEIVIVGILSIVLLMVLA